jgi:hypothetical protein
VPIQPAFGFQFGSELIRERLKIVGIVAGVALHPLGERPHGPIGFLGAFFELNTQVGLHQVAQAELAQSEQPGRQHGIEDGAGNELVVFAKQPQVVVGAMHDQLVPGQGIENWVQNQLGQGIDQPIAIDGADLDQTHLFGVGMQAIGLCINRYPGSMAKYRQEFLQLLFIIDH